MCERNELWFMAPPAVNWGNSVAISRDHRRCESTGETKRQGRKIAQLHFRDDGADGEAFSRGHFGSGKEAMGKPFLRAGIFFSPSRP
jgi:hypothetical protein